MSLRSAEGRASPRPVFHPLVDVCLCLVRRPFEDPRCYPPFIFVDRLPAQWVVGTYPFRRCRILLRSDTVDVTQSPLAAFTECHVSGFERLPLDHITRMRCKPPS